jgi:aminopeptidase N
MREAAPRTIRLEDYAPPDFLIDAVELDFDLAEDVTRVRARLTLRRNPERPASAPLVLDGQGLELLRVAIDGEALAPGRYQADEEHLTVADVPDAFTLETEVRIRPGENTALEGLYVSGPVLCTQCEAEGFRRITYYLDRPDVMARFTTTLTADRARYPVLLSNGNAVERAELPDGRHRVRWQDPFPKPCYLFALVAGDLVEVADTFTTRSGREVALRIYVEPQNADKCVHAMRSLQEAMRWDEEVFGREYDLDVYMIVAVDTFNMGAMENKGLNVFNSKYVLARPDTATDADFLGIQGVIAHEYFHNWTGNRVTCRDWFQLSLKEGLTVFRDQEFSADLGARAVKRIGDVRRLRTVQFAEDAGPMAHPVRPESYIEINNFYTPTVYEKGAEVIRMAHTLLGREGFRRGMDLYFARHDGQAVTIEDFLRAMEDANGADLGQFRLWYSQAGTPEVTVEDTYDPATRTCTLRLAQRVPPTPGQPEKRPMHVPIAMALLDPEGRELALRLEGEAEAGPTTRVLSLREAEQTFRFVDVPAPPVPSLLRGFSAPVRLVTEASDERLAFLMAHDADPFARWEAAQQLATRTLLGLVADQQAGRPLACPPHLVAAFARVLETSAADPAIAAETLTLPSESYLADQSAVADPGAVHEAREGLRRALAEALREPLLAAYRANQDSGPYRVEPGAIGRRSLKNLCLAYLAEVDDPALKALAPAQYRGADNMTDTIGALAVLANHDSPERVEALDDFYRRWRQDPLVVDKWLALQASSRLPGTLGEVRRLLTHPAFDLRNPNRVRALIGAFAHGNPARFHAPDGAGYAFLADQVLALDPLNPQVAARLLGAMSRWRRLEPARQQLVRAELERVLGREGLSKDTYEVASKSLGG